MLFSLASTLIISSILLFSVGRLRLAIYSIRRLLYPSECRRPENILPLEMWTSILENLDDNDLRAAATACRLFNEIGFTIFLLINNNCSTESIPSGALSIQSPFTRPGGLQRAIFFHTIRRLSFTLTGSTILRDLEVLRGVLPYASGVTDLELSFPQPLLLDHRHVGDERNALIAALRSILYRSTAQVDNGVGPVGFVGGSVGFFTAIKIARLERESGIRTRLQRWIAGLSLTFIRTLKIIPLPPSSAHRLGRMILINDQTSKCLELLGETRDGVLPTAHEVNLMLPHLALPSLKELRIRTPEIDPTLLIDFFGRHSVEKLSYEPTHASGPLPSAFITPPVDLPNLKVLSTVSDPFCWLSSFRSVPAIPLINSVKFSPLCRIEIRYNLETSDVVDSWKATLRRIAELDAETRLTIVLTPVPSMHWEFPDRMLVDEEERSILNTLRNVTDVEVQPVHLRDANRLLPWLTMLPALTRVTFRQPRNQQYPSVTAFKSEVAAHVSSGVVVDVKSSEYRDA
ncbi:hypothetical protein C8R43DRAFT_954577 [Mycena crocata]|nr:hypothetical protein C8R43DRAFT_954577 [Mycena crocata]